MAQIDQRLDTSDIVLTFKMPRFWGFRMWLLIRLLQLADIVAPITIEVSINDD